MEFYLHVLDDIPCENTMMQVWCYTTDPQTRWDYCPVPHCGQSTCICNDTVSPLYFIFASKPRSCENLQCYLSIATKATVLYLYCDGRRDIRWNITGARGIYQGLRLYFIVYPDSSHNTEILNYNSIIDHLGDQYWKSWFSVLLRQQLGNTGKYCPVDRAIMESLILILYCLVIGNW